MKKSSRTSRTSELATRSDTYDAISTKLDVREFAPGRVADGNKARILEAARLTGSSMNSQHWRFILVSDLGNPEP